MKKSYQFLVTILFLGAYLLSACGGALPQQNNSQQGVPAGSSQSTEAVFTGTVEAKEGTVWLISGQQVNVDGAASVDPNVQIGDIVRVEAKVSADGAVVALKIEASSPDDGNANDDTSNDNAGNDNGSNTNDDDNSNTTNDNGNTDDNSNGAPSGVEQEVFGAVEDITADSITINGITYSIASFTEFKDLIAVGDQVKIHVIVNADGTFTIREIEKSTETGIGDDNGNSNDDNANYNGNSNDDDSNDDSDDHSNGNSNDDDDDDNSNDDNSNDD